MRSFSDLGLLAELVEALANQGFTEPFPIQAVAIRDALEGRDVCGRAKTGSGKTLAFGLPVLQRVHGMTRRRKPSALLPVPTRERAGQVVEDLQLLADAIDVRIDAFYGGTDIERDPKRLARGVEVVVAPPGRLIDLIGRKAVSLSDIAIVVLDEADRMADMGFLPQVD